MVPFLDQTLYVGPMVSVLGGADVSWIVGFVVAGAGYLVASRVVGADGPGQISGSCGNWRLSTGLGINSFGRLVMRAQPGRHERSPPS
jgi:hypothetical protein